MLALALPLPLLLFDGAQLLRRFFEDSAVPSFAAAAFCWALRRFSTNAVSAATGSSRLSQSHRTSSLPPLQMSSVQITSTMVLEINFETIP
jgi:hypothetical protein|eukprot:jgi/Chrpa1/16909/Chrysochromulina_OHIO_Genome00005314-RA